MLIPQIDDDGKGYSNHMNIQDFIKYIVLLVVTEGDAKFPPEKYIEILNWVKLFVAEDLEHEERIIVNFGEFYLRPKDRPAPGQKVDPEKIMIKIKTDSFNINTENIFNLFS